MSTHTAIAGQTDWQAAATWYEGVVPGNDDTIIINEGSQSFTNLSPANTGQILIIGPGFNGSIDGYNPTSIAQVHMNGGTGARVRINATCTGFMTKIGGGSLTIASAALPIFWANRTSGISILESCDLSLARLTNAHALIMGHASAIVDSLSVMGGSLDIRRDMDQALFAAGARAVLRECAVNDGAAGGLLTIDSGAMVEVIAKTAQTFDDVILDDGVLSCIDCTVLPTFGGSFEVGAFAQFIDRNRAGTKATATITPRGFSEQATYGGKKSA